MRNPITDVIAFLSKPSYSEPFVLHYVYWIAAIASLSIAIAAWGSLPDQARFSNLWRFAVRFLLGSFWWEQSLWKFPTDTGGLEYWTNQEVQHSAFAIQGTLTKAIVLPIFEPFAYCVYGFEALVAILLLLGLFTRVVSSLGAVLIASLWLGLYNAPGEWPWSYVFLLVLMVTMAIENFGLSLGLDAYLLARGPAARLRRAAAMG